MSLAADDADGCRNCGPDHLSTSYFNTSTGAGAVPVSPDTGERACKAASGPTRASMCPSLGTSLNGRLRAAQSFQTRTCTTEGPPRRGSQECIKCYPLDGVH